MKPMCRARHPASARSDRLLISVPPIVIEPRDGRSMPASRFNSVDLPEPDGPISPMKSPASTVIDTRSSTEISIASRLYDLVTSRSSMSGMLLLPFQSNGTAVGEPGRRIQDQCLARRDTALDLDLIEPVAAEDDGPLARGGAADNPHRRGAVLVGDGALRNQDDRRGHCGRRRCR